MNPQLALVPAKRDVCHCHPDGICHAYGTPVCRVSNGPQPRITVSACLGGFRAVMEYQNPETGKYEEMARDGEVFKRWWECHDHALTWAIQAKMELK